MFCIAICDNDESNKKTIEKLCKESFTNFFGDYKVRYFSNTQLFLNSKEGYDLIFLNINLPSEEEIELKNCLIREDRKSLVINLINCIDYEKDDFFESTEKRLLIWLM